MRAPVALALAALLAGCGPGEPVVTPLLDYGFGTGRAERSQPLPFGAQPSPHAFGGEWSVAPRDGLWMHGREASLDVVGGGHDAVLRLDLVTAGELAQRGQRLVVLVNGEELANVGPGTDWEQPGRHRIVIPARQWKRGRNVLGFRASEVMVPVGPEGRPHPPYSVCFLSLRLSELGPEGFLDDAIPDPHPATPPAGGFALREVAPEDAGDGPRPDILLVVLDAARADHFGSYGYSRDTTPVVDRLAREGLRFDAAFSPAPYTLAAMASLTTGRSWAQHQVVVPGDRLPGSLPTLPGILREHGWTTAGFSPNPNASRSTGFDRGFDHFYEEWVDEDFRRGLSPGGDRPARFLWRWLGENPVDGPLFASLHLALPHEPYRPGARHRLFDDPAYEGPVTGRVDNVRAIARGEVALAPADLEQLVALYDGNLHWGDALVGETLERWREARPGRELLVVVSSDHGEGFGEHGAFTHTSLLQDEMTRVPLVMWPRALVEPIAAGTGQLRSLEDVLPMLLHCLGLPLPAGAWPSHSVELLADPGWERPVVLMRNETRFGWRTPHELFVHDRFAGRQLYRLAADPGRQQDLCGTQGCLGRAVGLARLLGLAGAGRPGVAAADAPDAATREQLRALGYTD